MILGLHQGPLLMVLLLLVLHASIMPISVEPLELINRSAAAPGALRYLQG